ncbi:hypothetical protein NFHSH190041_17240 [Shewanella sp. NFH-SH190041]|uniref:hypothetical protein n=1 Tax=Shewanella sp. NFH-SH190041 TaxID=2950245 RepID=UPI0021C476E8|nr:hypothetical protein [Shewanella sp. NFH-SH190041]BDM64272.1 hypothetical protein NFHSH190041_17240 [Shewanella sp. NFH-SH190041]
MDGFSPFDVLQTMLVPYIGSVTLAYLSITLLIYKTRVLASVNRFTREYIHNVLVIVSFGFITYQFMID